MPDDFPADTSTTGTLTPNTPVSAVINANVSGDQDWFAITLTQGTKYRIDAEGGSSFTNTQIGGIYDAQGDLIARTTNFDGGIGRDARVWFVAPETGTYYVSAGAGPGVSYGDDQPYTLTVFDDWDDIGPEAATAPALSLDRSPIAAEIDERDDTDLFSVSLDAGQQVELIATGGTSTYFVGRSFQTDVGIAGIRDASGTLLADTTVSTPGQTVERLLFTAPEAGTYTVEVTGEGTASEGEYTLSAQVDDLTAGPDTPGIVIRIDDDESVRLSTLFPGDEDWIVVPLTEGETYEFLVTGTDGAPQVALYDADGTAITGASGGSGVVYTAPTTGTYFAAITGDTPTTQGDYRLQVLRDAAPADVTTQATAPADGAATTVRLHDGDTDWLGIALSAGQSYEISVTGSSGFDPAITGLYDATGTLIDGTPRDDGPLAFTPTTDGTYYLGLAAQDGASAGTATLRVFVDDYPEAITTTGQVAVDGSVMGTLDRVGDRDWFAADLMAGTTYLIDLEGSRTGQGTLRDPFFQGIYTATGTYISGTANDDGGDGLNSRATFTPDSDGTYYLSARAYADGGTGTYTLSLDTLVDDFTADTTTTGTLAVGGTAMGEITFGGSDRDWFAITLEAEETYIFDLVGTGSDALREERLEIFDSSGVSTGLVDFGFNSGTGNLTFTAPEDGIFYLEAGARFASTSTSFSGGYTLSATQLVSVTGTAGNDWLTLPDTGGAGLARIAGSTGVDMMSFSGLDGRVFVNLHTDEASAIGSFYLVMDSIENVSGSSFSDTFIGSDRSEKVRGLGGRDTIHGSDGERDTIDGGSSTDTITYVASSESVSVSLLRGRGWTGDAAGDRISNVENITGSNHDDMIWGDGGANRLEGLHGDDTITGGAGDDYIAAGFGTDVIVFSDNRDAYDVVTEGIRTTVTHLNDGFDGTDIIGHAEVLRFADGDVIL